MENLRSLLQTCHRESVGINEALTLFLTGSETDLNFTNLKQGAFVVRLHVIQAQTLARTKAPHLDFRAAQAGSKALNIIVQPGTAVVRRRSPLLHSDLIEALVQSSNLRSALDSLNTELAKSQNLRHVQQAKRLEAVARVFMGFAKDPDIEDVSLEVFLACKSGDRRTVISVVVGTCTDTVQKALRRRLGKLARCALKGMPAAFLVALPNLVQDFLSISGSYTDRVAGAGGIIFVLAAGFFGVRNAYREWRQEEFRGTVKR